MSTNFQKLSSGEIKVNGEIGHRMQITAEKILDHLDIEGNFARHFKKRLKEPLVPGGFAGIGMLLDAIVKATAAGVSGERMQLLKEKIIGELSASQSNDGNISVFADKVGAWDNHEQAYIIIALTGNYALCGDENSLETALRLGDFLLQRKTLLNLGLEQALLMLHKYSGEKRFLDYCLNEFNLTCSMEEYDRLLPVNGIRHVYTFMARIHAQLILGDIIGEYKNLTGGAHELFRRILNGGYSSVSGTCTGGGVWGELWDNSQIGLGRWGETCATAYLLRICRKMLEIEGNSIYGDLYERALYNALFAAQSPDGLNQRYFTPFNEPGVWYERETYCCPNNLRRIMFELPQAVYLKSGDGLVINLYEESSVKTEINGTDVELTQNTGYPNGDSSHIKVGIAKPAGFSLLFRVPRWSRGFSASTGTETYYGSPGNFLEIKRLWHNGDKIDINLPASVQLIKGTVAQQGKLAVKKGPVVYALDQELNNLSKHELATLFLDHSGPAEFNADGLTLRGEIHMMGIREKKIRFTRFSSPGRTITYLPASRANLDKAVEDELYNQDSYNPGASELNI